MFTDNKMNLQNLAGRTITSIRISEGECDLALICDGGAIVISTEGDCCSETWFADITGLQALLSGKPILKIEELELPVPDPEDNRTRQEYDCYYGITLTTEKGRCDIVYRNSSNGYYGGWIESVALSTIGAVKDWKEIKEDWSA